MRQAPDGQQERAGADDRVPTMRGFRVLTGDQFKERATTK